MAISRFWRLVGLNTRGNGVLELSEARIYESGALADAGATLTATIEPASGVLADLRDGLALSVVTWPHTSYAQPGFALVWDFGAGAGVESPKLRLGGGTSDLTFALDLMLQQSSDGQSWDTFMRVINYAYPGNGLTTPLWAVSDPYFSYVSLLLNGLGINASKVFTDESLRLKVPDSVVGNIALSTVESKSGGSSLYPNGGLLRYADDLDLRIGSNDWTLEAWVFQTNNAGYQTIFSKRDNDTGAYYEMGTSAGGIAYFYNGQIYLAGAISLNTWAHFAVCRLGAVTTIYINGVGTSIGNVQPNVALIDRSLYIGGIFMAGQTWKGYLDNLRITKGVARYFANFTPPIDFAGVTWSVDAPLARANQTLSATERLLPSADPGFTTAQHHLREYPFFDAYNGGTGLIAGTVKEKNLPDNVPLHRKVWLIDEASAMVIRETWSDAVTGDYEFRGIKQGLKYTVLAYDYTGLYRGVIADAQVPEVLP